MKIKFLEWDSTFFNIKIGTITFERNAKLNWSEINSLIKRSSFDLVYIFENLDFFPESSSDLQYLVDTKIIFSKKINFCNEDIPEIVNYQEFIEAKLEELYSLALDSGAYSRFKIDKRFKNSDFIKLYHKWIDNYLGSDIGNDLFLYVENDRLLGFITVSYSCKVATIGLIAVNKDVRGKSIGTKLLKKVEKRAVLNGCTTVVVATQLQNKIACNFYSRNGYKISEIKNIYHIWK